MEKVLKNLSLNKKSGTLSQNEMDSALVGHTGFEPVTSTLSR